MSNGEVIELPRLRLLQTVRNFRGDAMTIAEQIYALVRALPADQASEVLTFAEFVQAKYKAQATSSTVSTVSPAWTDLVESLSGAWCEDFPTLAEIRSESGKDVERENL